MHNRPLAGFLVAAAVALSACGPSEDAGQAQTDQAAPPAGTTMLDQAKSRAQATETAVARGKEAAVEKGREMAEQAKPAIKAAGEGVAERVERASDLAAERGAAVAQSVGEVADAAVEKARELIQQTEDYIAENKPELAQKAVNKLNVLKDVMPKAIQAQIDKLNARLGHGGAGDPAAVDAPVPPALPPTQ